MLNISKDALDNFKEKMKKKSKKTSIEKVIITGFVFVLVLGIIILLILISNTKKRLEGNSNKLPEYAQNLSQEKFEDTKEQVKDQGEMRRMKTYLGDIFTNIEDKKYEEIYARLDNKFKEGYFPKIKVLEDYLVGEFPKDAGYKIKNFERIGELYVYVVDVVSVTDSRKKIDMKFVFEEYELNDYKFSFSKI